MGYYIETTVVKGKAEELLKFAGVHEVPLTLLVGKASKDLIPVVVVDNGPFEAAGIAFDLHELEAFVQPDGRFKRYLLVPRSVVVAACPYVERMLKWV